MKDIIEITQDKGRKYFIDLNSIIGFYSYDWIDVEPEYYAESKTTWLGRKKEIDQVKYKDIRYYGLVIGLEKYSFDFGNDSGFHGENALHIDMSEENINKLKEYIEEWILKNFNPILQISENKIKERK